MKAWISRASTMMVLQNKTAAPAKVRYRFHLLLVLSLSLHLVLPHVLEDMVSELMDPERERRSELPGGKLEYFLPVIART